MIHVRTGWIRAVLFALLWWILTDGATDSWLIGVPAVLFATVASLMRLPTGSGPRMAKIVARL